MNNFTKILLLGGFIFLLPKLSKGNQLEESDLQFIADFCPLSFSETAGTTNFQLSEFHSKDGIQVPKSLRGNVQILMDQLEIIRSVFDSPLIVNSGWRSPSHNEAEGGEETSLHLCAMATDFKIPGVSHNEVQEAMLSLMENGQIIDGGLGRYNTHTHYDIGESRRWDKR